MRNQKYPIDLTAAARDLLKEIASRGDHKVRVVRRAQMLLWSDEGKSDLEIADLLEVTPLTVATTRERWVKAGTLNDKPKRGRSRRLDGQQEAFLMALVCSAAHEGREQWSMQLLADRLVELKVIEEPISDETVRTTLKKVTSSPGLSSSGA
jgi:transposase